MDPPNNPPRASPRSKKPSRFHQSQNQAPSTRVRRSSTPKQPKPTPGMPKLYIPNWQLNLNWIGKTAPGTKPEEKAKYISQDLKAIARNKLKPKREIIEEWRVSLGYHAWKGPATCCSNSRDGEQGGKGDGGLNKSGRVITASNSSGSARRSEGEALSKAEVSHDREKGSRVNGETISDDTNSPFQIFRPALGNNEDNSRTINDTATVDGSSDASMRARAHGGGSTTSKKRKATSQKTRTTPRKKTKLTEGISDEPAASSSNSNSYSSFSQTPNRSNGDETPAKRKRGSKAKEILDESVPSSADSSLYARSPRKTNTPAKTKPKPKPTEPVTSHTSSASPPSSNANSSSAFHTHASNSNKNNNNDNNNNNNNNNESLPPATSAPKEKTMPPVKGRLNAPRSTTRNSKQDTKKSINKARYSDQDTQNKEPDGLEDHAGESESDSRDGSSTITISGSNNSNNGMVEQEDKDGNEGIGERKPRVSYGDAGMSRRRKRVLEFKAKEAERKKEGEREM